VNGLVVIKLLEEPHNVSAMMVMLIVCRVGEYQQWTAGTRQCH